MNRLTILAPLAMLAGCVSTETGVHSYNGNTVEIALYGDTFALGSADQQQAQIAAAKVKAEGVCGGPAQYLDRRMDHQPQNGFYYVEANHLALFKCVR